MIIQEQHVTVSWANSQPFKSRILMRNLRPKGLSLPLLPLPDGITSIPGRFIIIVPNFLQAS